MVGENGYTGSFSTIQPKTEYYFGRNAKRNRPDFFGQLDEIRVWNVVRTGAQIRETMHKRLVGDEPGLIGLWNFDDGTASDSSPSGFHGKLKGNAVCVVAPFPPWDGPASLSGVVTDENANPVSGAKICLELKNVLVAETQTNVEGRYRIELHPADWLYDLIRSRGERRHRSRLPLEAGRSQTLSFSIHLPVHLSGHVRAFDDTPHGAIPVEAIEISNQANEQMGKKNGRK